MEQTYKIRESETISGFADIQKIVDESFVKEVMQRFNEMGKSIDQAILRGTPVVDEEDEFDLILW